MLSVGGAEPRVAQHRHTRLPSDKSKAHRVSSCAPLSSGLHIPTANGWRSFVARAFSQSLQHIVQGETADLLARREFPESGQELRDVLLRRNHYEQMLRPPARIIHALVVGGLERIGAQVEELWEAQCHERLLPHVKALRTLFGEDDLVLQIAQRDEGAVIVEIKELLARAGRFASQRVGNVVAVEMNLKALVADHHSFK